MRTITATFVLSESGSVVHEVYVDQSTYKTFIPLSHYGSPWLGEWSTSEDFRRALGAYAIQTASDGLRVIGCHGERLAFVDEACSTYVFTIDFDTAGVSNQPDS